MQAKQLARADDETQPHAAGNTRTTRLIVDDDTAARLTISAMISNDDDRVVLGTGAADAANASPAPMRSLPNRSTPRNCAAWYMAP
jgi:hypothetical protein